MKISENVTFQIFCLHLTYAVHGILFLWNTIFLSLFVFCASMGMVQWWIHKTKLK